MRRAAGLLALALALATGCAAEMVSPPPLEDYTAWQHVERSGDVPGHGDSYRVIYFNDVAQNGTTTRDTILVKEVYANDNGAPGALRSVAIMRKLVSGPARDNEGGWLFTQSPTPGGAEEHLDLCWNRCHAQAPFSGVWLDYTKL